MIFPALLRPYVAHVAHLTHVFYLWVPRDHRKKIWFRPKGDVVQLPNGTLWMYYFGGAKFVGPRFTRDVERFFLKKYLLDHEEGRKIKQYRNRKPFNATCRWSKEALF
jgi:hypothetical protein